MDIQQPSIDIKLPVLPDLLLGWNDNHEILSEQTNEKDENFL